MIGAGVEGTAVMIFFRIGELFEEAAVQKTRHSISELVEMQPVSVRVVRDSKEMTVRPEDVAVGEHYIVLPGERIPIDGTVISGYSSLDTKAITGESMPKNVAPRESALSGCINVTGALAVKADRAYSDSAVARILDLIEESGAGKAGTENFITAFAKYYTSSVVAAAAVAVVPTLLFGLPYEVWVYRALVFLVVSCPCALVLSVPLTFFCGVGRASKSGILINGGDIMDRLALTDTVVVDKTGTVTKGSFEFSGIYAHGVTEDYLPGYAAKSEYRSDHPISAAIIDRYGRDIYPGEIGKSVNLAGKGIKTEVNGRIVHAGNAGLMEDIGVRPCGATVSATSIHVAIDGTYSGHMSI